MTADQQPPPQPPAPESGVPDSAPAGREAQPLPDAQSGPETQPLPDAQLRASVPDELPSPALEPVVAQSTSMPATPSGGRRGLGAFGYVLAALGGIAVAVAALAATGSLTLGTPEPSPSPSPSPSPAPYADGRSLGDPAAPVTLEVWADFQCPYCGLQARAVTPSVERLYATEGRVLITYHDYAFLGQESIDAAVAARCAGQQGSFWYYHDLLFASQQGENQGAFAQENLLGLARFAGLDETTFTACLADATVLQEVKDETAEGSQVGISSTPVMRIEGPGGLQVLTGLKPLSEVEAAIERAEQPQPSSSPGASPSGSGGESPTPSASGAPAASPSGTTSPAASPSAPVASPSPSPSS